MLCERCKEKEATIRYTEIINGAKSEHNLCPSCAQEVELGYELPFAKLLSGMLGAYTVGGNTKKYDDMEKVICPSCKMSYQEFIDQGIFGCEVCYQVFEPLIRDNIEKLQGNVVHNGKVPIYNKNLKEANLKTKKITPKEQVEILEIKLKEAIEHEDYEEAAKLRDEIKAFKERKDANA